MTQHTFDDAGTYCYAHRSYTCQRAAETVPAEPWPDGHVFHPVGYEAIYGPCALCGKPATAEPVPAEPTAEPMADPIVTIDDAALARMVERAWWSAVRAWNEYRAQAWTFARAQRATPEERALRVLLYEEVQSADAYWRHLDAEKQRRSGAMEGSI